jgi:hypothetical protein
MIHSSRRDRKIKAFAEALAMIADAHHELDPHRQRPRRASDEAPASTPWLRPSRRTAGGDKQLAAAP